MNTKKAQLTISINQMISVFIGAIILVLIFMIIGNVRETSQGQTEIEISSKLENMIKGTFSQEEYSTKLDLKKEYSFNFDSKNIIIPELKSTIDIQYSLLSMPTNFRDREITVFTRRSDTLIGYLNYVFIFPTSYSFVLSNSPNQDEENSLTDSYSSQLLSDAYSLLPEEEITNPETGNKEEFFKKSKIISPSLTEAINKCGLNTCYFLVVNSYFSHIPEKNQKIILINVSVKKEEIQLGKIKREIFYGNITYSNGDIVPFFDIYSFLSAAIINDKRIYNNLFEKIVTETKYNFKIENKTLTYLYDFQSEKCKQLFDELNDEYENIISNLESLSSFNNSYDKELSNLINSTLESYYIQYELKNNDCKVHI